MATATGLKVSVVPNEILFPRATVAVEAPSALDAEAAQGGIVVQGQRGTVALDRAGRLASWSPEADSLPPGQHCLVVRGLLSRSSRSASTRRPDWSKASAMGAPLLRSEAFMISM